MYVGVTGLDRSPICYLLWNAIAFGLYCTLPYSLSKIRPWAMNLYSQGRRKQISVGAAMVCARSAREIFYVILIIHEQSRTYYGVYRAFYQLLQHAEPSHSRKIDLCNPQSNPLHGNWIHKGSVCGSAIARLLYTMNFK